MKTKRNNNDAGSANEPDMGKARRTSPLGFICAALVTAFLIAVCIEGWNATLEIHSADKRASCSAFTADGHHSIIVEEQPYGFYELTFGGEMFKVTVTEYTDMGDVRSTDTAVYRGLNWEGCIVDMNDDYGEIFLGDPEEIPRNRKYGLAEPLFRIYWEDYD